MSKTLGGLSKSTLARSQSTPWGRKASSENAHRLADRLANHSDGRGACGYVGDGH